MPKKEIQPGKELMTLTRSVLGSSLCWRAALPEGSTRKVPREWEYWLWQKKNLISWFLYQGRGFFWTNQYSPALTFLYVWRRALHHSCKFYETRYILSYVKPCESGSSLQPSNFPAKEQEQFTVKSIGTRLCSQICGFLASLPAFTHMHLPNMMQEWLYWPHFSGMTHTLVPARLGFALVGILDFSVAMFI